MGAKLNTALATLILGEHLTTSPITLDEIRTILDSLYEHRAVNLPPAALADIFDTLTWALDDESGLLRVREEWLVSDDRGRVEVALAVKETFPFTEAKKMHEAFAQISARWPDLSELCQQIQRERYKQRV